jgi:hypothetical protein
VHAVGRLVSMPNPAKTSKIRRPSILDVGNSGKLREYLQELRGLFIIFDSRKDVAEVVKGFFPCCGKGAAPGHTLKDHKIYRKERELSRLQ